MSSLPVYYLSFSLRDVRCFGPEQTLDLTDAQGQLVRWTFLVGDSGTGKTTLLQAMVLHERAYRSQFAGDGEWRGLLPSFVRVSSQAPGLCRLRVGVVESSEQPPRNVSEHGLTFTATSLRDLPAYSPEGTVRRPLCYAYGASRRLPPLGGGTTASEGTTATLFFEHALLRDPDDWFARHEAALQQSGTPHQKIRERVWFFSEVMRKVLPDLSQPLLVPASTLSPVPRVEVTTPFGLVPLRHLGQGQQMALAWLFDLVTRLLDRSPGSPHPLAEPAVVLVDGLDAHLHAAAAETLVAGLNERFPRTQFVVSVQNESLADVVPGARVARLRRRNDHVVLENG